MTKTTMAENIELLRQAYGSDDRLAMEECCEAVLANIRQSDFQDATITEPQLSALILMAFGYAKSNCPIETGGLYF